MQTVDTIINAVIAAEGGYVNDPNDRGGETNFGITIATARSAGYAGAMRDMPRETAVSIYRGRYFIAPGFGLIGNVSMNIAAELTDTGVNMGPRVPSVFLQRALNGLNQGGKDYADVVVDGVVGPNTATTLKAYLAKRGAEGERRLLLLLNALQGSRYLDLCEGRAANEAFLYGWLDRIGA